MPVVLPIEAIALDAFRRRHHGDSFWCGLLLGGCGARLADKLYVDRQCHFQHYPAGQHGSETVCRRRGVGESSADHLYVKGALASSLAGHGRAARFSYPDPIGSVLDVALDSGRQFRVHLDGKVQPSWEDGIPILGDGVALEPGTLSRCRYVYRVRLQSEGTQRRVWIGTESLARPTQWVPLAECGWTADGLVTEAAQRINNQPDAAAPPQARPLPEAVTRLIRGLESAQRSGAVEHVRRLCEGSDTFLQKILEPHAREQAQQALAEARTWLDAHMDYQRGVFADLQRAVDDKRAWDVREHYNRATALTRRGASEAERQVLHNARVFLQEKNHQPAPDTEARRREALRKVGGQPRSGAMLRHRPMTRLERARSQEQAAVARVQRLVSELEQTHMSSRRREAKLRDLQEAVTDADGALTGTLLRRIRRLREEGAAEKPALSPPERVAAPLSEEALASAAAAVRGALKRAARAQQTLTWAALKEQLGSALPAMTEQERQQLVALVDAASERELLSSILAAGDPAMAEAYRLSANLLGGGLPADDREVLREVIDADVRQTHTFWQHR